MEKRTIIALILITLIFIISNQFIWKNQNINTTFPDSTNNIVSKSTPDTLKESYFDVTSPDTNLIKFPKNIALNENITLENEYVKYIFTNKGARVHKIFLKKYKSADKKSWINLIPNNESILNLIVNFSNNTKVDLKDALYNFKKLKNNTIEFQIETYAGVITKRFSLTGYTLNLEIESKNGTKITNYDIDFSSGINDTEIFEKMKNYDYKFEADVDNVIHKLNLSKLKKRNAKFTGRVNWAAIKSKFFIISIIPDQLILTKEIEAFVNNYQKSGKNTYTPAMKLSINNKDVSLKNKYTLYIGPIVFNNLKQYGVGLENTVELGPKWLRWMSTFFLKILILINNFISSWGITIIIFSILLKLALFPITHKTFKSSSQMQKLQPKLKEIQKKYKHDPRLLHAETTKLYKEHGVNPLGGCLPMLIQIPILYALYPVLRYSINLRQTSFLYIKDLSAPDPYYIIPILMAVFMFIQQKLAAPPKKPLEEMDEKERATASTQKMMLYFMPIFFFFLFKSFPSGLVIYWTISNIISTIQQFYVKKKYSL